MTKIFSCIRKKPVLHSWDKMPGRRIRKTDYVEILRLKDRWYSWRRCAADGHTVAEMRASVRTPDEAIRLAQIANPGLTIRRGGE